MPKEAPVADPTCCVCGRAPDKTLIRMMSGHSIDPFTLMVVDPTEILGAYPVSVPANSFLPDEICIRILFRGREDLDITFPDFQSRDVAWDDFVEKLELVSVDAEAALERALRTKRELEAMGAS